MPPFISDERNGTPASDMVSELNRATALIQLRTISTAMGLPFQTTDHTISNTCEALEAVNCVVPISHNEGISE